MKLPTNIVTGKWIAVGGGGYDIWRVVPRAWSLIWLEMTENSNCYGSLPKEWLDYWQKESPVTITKRMGRSRKLIYTNS